MACYKRILYFDYYDNGMKHSNAGFVKLTRWKEGEDALHEGQVDFQMYAAGVFSEEEIRGEVKLLADNYERSLGEILISDGEGTFRISGQSDVLMCDDQEDEQGRILLRVEINNDSYFECVLRAEKKKDNKNVQLEAAEAEENKKEVRIPIVKNDKWTQLWENFLHIRPFEDDREYIKLELRDMVVLSNLYYRLVGNSFLMHGYYNYEHLVLMKMNKRGKERIYIGVPGNFYEKEKQVAIMFGFESFETKIEPAEDGDFGYYLIHAEI